MMDPVLLSSELFNSIFQCVVTPSVLKLHICAILVCTEGGQEKTAFCAQLQKGK